MIWHNAMSWYELQIATNLSHEFPQVMCEKLRSYHTQVEAKLKHESYHGAFDQFWSTMTYKFYTTSLHYKIIETCGTCRNAMVIL